MIKKNLFEPSMPIYLPPEIRLEATPAAPAAATPVTATAVDSAAVAPPEITAAELGGSVKAQPGGGSWILSRVASK